MSATYYRKRIQRSAEEGETGQMNEYFKTLYSEYISPNKDVRNPEAFAPFLEAAILAKVGNHMETREQLNMDLLYCHTAFNITKQEYEKMLIFLEDATGSREEIIHGAQEAFPDFKLNFVRNKST